MRRLAARRSDSNLNSAAGGISSSSSLSSDHLLPSNNSNGGSSSSLSSSSSPSRASIRKENNNDDDAAAKSRHSYWWEQLRIRTSNHNNNRLLLLLSSIFTQLKHIAHTNLLKFKHYLQTIDPVYAAIICIFIFVTLITLLVLEIILLLGPRGSIIGGLYGRLTDQYIKDYTRYQTMSKWKSQLMNELQLSHVVYSADQNMDGAYLVDERWVPLGNTLSSRPNYAVVEMLLREKERRLRLGEMIYNSVVMAADDAEEAVDNDVAGGCSSSRQLLPEVVLQLQTNDGKQQQQQTTKLLPYWLTNAISKLNHDNGNGNGAIKTITLDHSDIDPTSNNLKDQLLQQVELYYSAKEKSATIITSTTIKGGRNEPPVIPQSILNCPNFIRSKGKNNYYAIRSDPTLHCLGYFLGGIQLGDDDQILHQARSHITSILSTSSSLSSSSSCQQSKIGYTVLSNKSTPSNQVRKSSSVWSDVSTILSAFPSNHPAYLCLPPLQPKSVGISPYNTANEELSFQSTFVNKLLTSYESKRRESREDSNHHDDNGESIIQGVATLSCEFHAFTTTATNCCNQVSVTMFDSTDDGESIEKYLKNHDRKRGNQHHLVFTFVDNSEKEEKEQSLLDQQVSVSISERNQRFSSTKKKMHYKESIQKKMRRKSWGCEPGWWCNRCLQASMYGSFSKCSFLCGKCAPDFICNEREKETQVDVDVKVTGMNLSATDTADTKKRHHHQRIPRIIHQTYFEDLTKERFPQLVRLQNTWKAAGWEYRFYSDDTAREYIGENYPERFVSVFDALLPGAYKADFFRYLVLFKEGGIYADVDVMLDANLDQFITPDLAFFVPIDSVGGYADQNFCLWNGLIGSAPAHPILAKAIEWMVNLVSSRGDLYDMERAVCEVSGMDSMENWKIRAEPGLMLSGPCALGVAANRALGKEPLSKFVPDLTKQSSTADAATRIRHLESDDAIGDVMIMVVSQVTMLMYVYLVCCLILFISFHMPLLFQADKNDLGSFRFSDPERNIFFASTDMPGLGKAPLVYKEGGGGSIRSTKKKKVRPHYSTCSHGDALWGTHDVYADNLVSPDRVKIHIRYE